MPNLVADHCYVLDMPIGMVQLADCTDRQQQGLLVQVTQRLDVRDQQACPSNVGRVRVAVPVAAAHVLHADDLLTPESGPSVRRAQLA